MAKAAASAPPTISYVSTLPASPSPASTSVTAEVFSAMLIAAVAPAPSEVIDGASFTSPTVIVNTASDVDPSELVAPTVIS